MAGRISAADISSEFPAYYKSLSRRLYKVLEDIGVSTTIRDVQVKFLTTEEILLTTIFTTDAETERSMYVCGSQYESTLTDGLLSDHDFLLVIESLPVVISISEAQHYRHCLVLVQDPCTPAGYAKLQCVFIGVPLRRSSLPTYVDTTIDSEGRYVYTTSLELLPYTVQHGPANCTEGTDVLPATDRVPAVRCRAWPACASEWFTRRRDHNWPTQDQLDKCRTLGCFLVQVGHPTSAEKHLQWRLSFTLQERMLVTDFNSVQLKCYVLLKMIKKEIIQTFLGEEALTSYYFKTCMLYMKETTPAELWTVDNLLVCLHKCLVRMLVYVERGECPNYFIPGENMFEGRIFGQVQIRLHEILRNILSADFKYLLGISCDELGNRYQRALVSESCTLAVPYDSSLISANCTVGCLMRLCIDRYISLAREQIISARSLLRLKLQLQSTESVTEHSVEETQEASSLVIPYIDICLMSVLIVEAKRLSKSNEFIFNLLTSDRWQAISLESDSYSAKLKQACLMHVLGYYKMSLEILLALEYRVGRKISGCGCINIAPKFRIGDLEAISAAETISLKKILHRCWIPCVIFLPAERELVPLALCYEMESAGSPPDERADWYDCAVVDGKILLYFLLYLNHRQLGMEANVAADIDNIRWLIRTEISLGHRETAFNLLGWIYKERGLYDQAVECFHESLAVKSSHNAAYLHWQDLTSIQ